MILAADESPRLGSREIAAAHEHLSPGSVSIGVARERPRLGPIPSGLRPVLDRARRVRLPSTDDALWNAGKQYLARSRHLLATDGHPRTSGERLRARSEGSSSPEEHLSAAKEPPSTKSVVSEADREDQRVGRELLGLGWEGIPCQGKALLLTSRSARRADVRRRATPAASRSTSRASTGPSMTRS